MAFIKRLVMEHPIILSYSLFYFYWQHGYFRACNPIYRAAINVIFDTPKSKLKVMGVYMLNVYCRVACVLCATLISLPALSQELSGWSDKTICRLASNQPDEPLYLQEVIKRALVCADYPLVNPSVVVPKHSNSSGY